MDHTAAGVLIIEAIGPKRDKQPPHPLLQKGVAAAAQPCLCVRRQARQRLQFHAVWLDGVKAPDDAAQPLCFRARDGVQKHGHLRHIAQRLQGAGLEVCIRHTDAAGIDFFRHAPHVLGAHGAQHVHIAHANQHVVRIVHNGDIAARARALAHQNTGGIHACGAAAGKQHLAERITAHRAGKRHRHAQARKVIADIAANAAQRDMQRAGVGITQANGRITVAVHIHVGAARAENTLVQTARPFPPAAMGRRALPKDNIYCTSFGGKRQAPVHAARRMHKPRAAGANYHHQRAGAPGQGGKK